MNGQTNRERTVSALSLEPRAVMMDEITRLNIEFGAANTAQDYGAMEKIGAALRDAYARARKLEKVEARFLTIYPQSWFGSGGGKQHAIRNEGFRFDQYGNVEPRGMMREALCRTRGSVSGSPFTATEGNAITCSRCAKRVREELVSAKTR